LFLATCDDVFGKSSIIGAIGDHIIEFDKYYLQEDHIPIGANYESKSFYFEPKFRKIFFSGVCPNALAFQGHYYYPGVSNPDGSWQMIKVQKQRS